MITDRPPMRAKIGRPIPAAIQLTENVCEEIAQQGNIAKRLRHTSQTLLKVEEVLRDMAITNTHLASYIDQRVIPNLRERAALAESLHTGKARK